MDAERRAGKLRGPLHGIPVLVKDNIDTADTMRRPRARSRSSGATPARDAAVVARLRAAGAVLLGKTNLSEWANIRSTRSTSGWSGARRPDAEPVRARSQPVRLELGLGRGGRGEPVRGRDRHRDRRLDRVPVGDVQRHRRDQADGRAGQPRRHHPDLALAGHRGADGAHACATRRCCSRRSPAPTRATRRPRAGEGRGRLHACLTGDVRGLRIGVVRSIVRLRSRAGPAVRCRDRGAEAPRRRWSSIRSTLPACRRRCRRRELTVLLYELKADLNAYLATRERRR